MYDDHPSAQGFFDDPSPSGAAVMAFPTFPGPPVPPLPRVNSKLTADPPPVVLLPAYARPRATEAKPVPQIAELSTWLVGIPALLFAVVLAPANPSAGVFTIGVLIGASSIYTAVTGRSSWMRFRSRKAALAPLALAAGLIGGSMLLPSSFIIAPKFMTAAPVATAEQTTVMMAGFAAIDPRMPTALPVNQMIVETEAICLNDFSSQTPEQQVSDITSRIPLPTEPVALTPLQARQTLSVIRSSFCGEPGEREATIDTEIIWAPPLIAPGVEWCWTQIDGLIP